MDGQCTILIGGEKRHIRFGVNATGKFLLLYGINYSDFAKPWQENEIVAMRNMIYCGLLSGDTRNDLPEGFDPEICGQWLDDVDDKAIKKIEQAYLSSKIMGKRIAEQ